MTAEELHAELLGLYSAINNATTWLCIMTAFFLILLIIEFVRFCIVIKKQVTGRMNHVSKTD